MATHYMNTYYLVCTSESCEYHCRRPQGEEEEFFVQLFLEPDPTLSLPTIEDLLVRMFNEQNIRFSKVATWFTDGLV